MREVSVSCYTYICLRCKNIHTEIKIAQSETKQPLKFKNPIFIVGCGRSGTTLLLNILGKHKNIYSVQKESYVFVPFITPINLIYENQLKTNNFEKLTISMLTTLFYGLEISPIMIWQENFPPDVKEIFGKIRNLYEYKELSSVNDVFNLCVSYLTLKENKTRWVEKTPNNIFTVHYILELYPDAKFIEIYRDARAVWCSWKNAKYEYFRNSNIFSCLKVWRSTISQGEGLSKKLLKEQYYKLRYEDLIKSPERELKSLCQFLGEQFEPEMLKTKVINSFYNDVSNKVGFSNIPVERWEKNLSNNELILIDLLTKKYRVNMGYPDSDAKLTIFNLFPFILFVLKKCIEGKKQLIPYLKSKLKLWVRGKILQNK